MTDIHPIKRALISVSDKRGLIEFAQNLQTLGVEILSTGGTYKLLCDNNIAAKEVSEHTGFAEMMDGRVKTLHPTIHGGILGRRGQDDAVMQEHEIAPIDLVVVNLYPFANTIAREDSTLADAIENIDIGGPAMVRSSAKNHAWVSIVVNPDDYPAISRELEENKGLSANRRFRLAAKAFEHTAQYDGMISEYLSRIDDNQTVQPTLNYLPDNAHLSFKKKLDLRYGENPHQKAAFYVEDNASCDSIAKAIQHQGKELSFNNVADTDAALECVKAFAEPACVIVKHANPCGVAISEQGILNAYKLAYRTDPESAFGGIIAFNRRLDIETAKCIIEQQFVEVIIAPEADEAAIEQVAQKPNVRLLTTGLFNEEPATQFDYKRVNGGLLIQDNDEALYSEESLKCVSQQSVSESQQRDLLFAWTVAKFVKSNAIVYAHKGATIGIGAGQMSRVNSARIAAIKAEHAGLSVDGAVMASDAFFPFRDGIDQAGQAGIKAVIQPGGSMRDEEVIAAADEANIGMLFTGMRHFRH